MRIISGSAKGRRLLGPKSHKIRPVADRVKESVYNILGDISEMTILDLFAGSGSVGLEAASRGAKIVYLVDFSPESLKLLDKNIENTHLGDNTKIIRGKIPNILSKIAHFESSYDIIFVDPPYDKDLVNRTLKALLSNNFVDDKTLIIIEHSPRELPECEGLSLSDQRTYGQTLITFLKKSETTHG